MKIIVQFLLVLLTCQIGFAQDYFTSTLLSDSIPDVFAIHASDIDLDGDCDIFVSAYSERLVSSGLTDKNFKLVWLENEDALFSIGGILFSTYGGILSGLDLTVYSQQFVDIDQDNNIDVLTSNYYKMKGIRCNGFQWHRNLGNGTFVVNTIDQERFGSSFGTPIISNMDDDSTLDILINRNGSLLRYKHTSSGYDDFDLVDTLFTEPFGNLLSEDLNGDGKDDLISNKNGVISWYENDGLGSFSPTEQTIFSGLFVEDVFFFDLNDDGNNDLITVQYNNGISFYKNDGNGTFETPTQLISFTNAPSNVQLNFGDIDNDDDVDILINNNLEGLNWIRNNGMEVFDQVYEIVDFPVRNMQAIDFDKDGYLDVITSNSADEIYLHRNNLADSVFTNLNNIEIRNDWGISISPNPMSEKTIIHFSQLPAFPFDVIMYDDNGKEILSLIGLEKNNVVVKNQDLAAGIYLINILQSDNNKLMNSIKVFVN